ncbi:MAG: alpha/beta hydrolase family protein [Betaproteobacteria bacterium]
MRPNKPSSFLARRRLLASALGLPIAALVANRTVASPASVDLDWHDSARDRPVPIRLHLPRSPAADAAPAPLVVFSHGLGGSRYGYTWLGEYWAAHGIASLHVQHVGSDRAIWAERGNPLAMLGLMRQAISEREAIARAHDVRFALDQLTASGFSQRIDTARVVMAGHSYGANTAMLLSGARIERAEFEAPLADRRVSAAILISAPPFHGEGSPKPILAPIRVPTLHVTATEDVIRVPGFFSDLDDRLAIFEAGAGPDKTLAVYAGGSHSMFTDRVWSGGEALNRSVKSATRELALGFVERLLKGRTPPLNDWPARHASILDRFVPSPVSSA